ncbi:hypothetical protein, partial [Shimazuella kribbensis]|uniref:hypothetical protein n=1 Tax=Shimazuella kribbensis TaxID=139808 RepID=UPI00048B3104
APYQPFANGGDPAQRPALAAPHQPFANGGDPTGRPAHAAPYQPFANGGDPAQRSAHQSGFVNGSNPYGDRTFSSAQDEQGSPWFSRSKPEVTPTDIQKVTHTTIIPVGANSRTQ